VVTEPEKERSGPLLFVPSKPGHHTVSASDRLEFVPTPLVFFIETIERFGDYTVQPCSPEFAESSKALGFVSRGWGPVDRGRGIFERQFELAPPLR